VVDGELQVKLAGHDFNPGDAMGSTGSDFSRLVLRYPGLMVGGDPFYNLNLRHHPADFGVWHDRDNN
jgi:hypothetical protein